MLPPLGGNPPHTAKSQRLTSLAEMGAIKNEGLNQRTLIV